MKKKHLLLSLMAGAILTGCSSNEDFTDGEKILDKETTNYLRVNIAQGGALTRAAFDNGEEYERKINSLFFVFYNVNGSPIATQEIGANDINWNNSGQNDWTHNSDDGNISDTRSLVIPVSLAAGSTVPSKMMVFANYINKSQSGDNLSVISSSKRSDYKDASGYFTMNNSVYFEGGTKKMEVPVTIDDFKPKADDATKSAGITVHLERLAAKVTVNDHTAAPITKEQESGTTTGKKYYLRFVPMAWGLNALEKETYLVKNFSSNSYSEIDNNLTGWSGWNDDTNKRCYWGRSVSYTPDATKYPRVSDDLDEMTAALDYVSYNDIIAKSGKGADFTDNTTTIDKIENALYCMENTVPSTISNAEYKNSAITSAIIAGYYRVYESNDAATANGDNYLKNGEYPATFYIYGQSSEIYIGDAEIMAKLATGQNVIKKKKGTGAPESLSTADYAKVFDLVHPSKDIRGNLKVGESYITLQVKNGAITLDDGYSLVYLDNTGTYQAYDTGKRKDANISIYQQVGRAEKFNNGQSYYAVLIEHLNRTKTEVTGTDGENTYTFNTGYYGVLRNHSYTININKIEGLGVGINDPKHKIVLPTENVGYNVTTTLNILSWNVVANQDVYLDKPIQ